MKILISAVSVLVLLGILSPIGMATTKPYWTASNATVKPDLKYHLFLDGVHPSSMPDL
jgi:hypothetical protein